MYQETNQLNINIMKITANTKINSGTHIVSIGAQTNLVTILQDTGEIVELRRSFTNKRLRAVKREMKSLLSSKETFSFETLSEEQIIKLINLLKVI